MVDLAVAVGVVGDVAEEEEGVVAKLRRKKYVSVHTHPEYPTVGPGLSGLITL